MKVIEWQDMETRAGWCPPCAKCLSMDYGWAGSGRTTDNDTYPWVVIILLRMQSSSAAAGWSWLFSFIFFTYKTVDQGYKSQMWIKTIPSTDAVPEINPKFTVIVTKYFRRLQPKSESDWDPPPQRLRCRFGNYKGLLVKGHAQTDKPLLCWSLFIGSPLCWQDLHCRQFQ